MPENSKRLSTSVVTSILRVACRRPNIGSLAQDAERSKPTSITWKRLFGQHGNPDLRRRLYEAVLMPFVLLGIFWIFLGRYLGGQHSFATRIDNTCRCSHTFRNHLPPENSRAVARR